MKIRPLLLLSIVFCMFQVTAVKAQLADQGLNSIMQIIDQAIASLEEVDEESDGEANTQANDALVNLSRTLGTLSYSRLQCGEAGVLAEFTLRVQQVAPEQGDAMRNAFQEGFDKSKEETTLLSADECERLTKARTRNVPEVEEEVEEVAEVEEEVVEEEPEKIQEPEELSYLRVAELTGQLAFKRKFCDDEEVFNRDYNQYLDTVPVDYREAAKEAYWKGYQRGKRLNKNLTTEMCAK